MYSSVSLNDDWTCHLIKDQYHEPCKHKIRSIVMKIKPTSYYSWPYEWRHHVTILDVRKERKRTLFVRPVHRMGQWATFFKPLTIGAPHSNDVIYIMSLRNDEKKTKTNNSHWNFVSFDKVCLVISREETLAGNLEATHCTSYYYLVAQQNLLYNTQADPCHLIGGLSVTW